MSVSAELQDSVDIDVQEVLLAASNHDIPRLRALIRKDEQLVNAQDAETGTTPLHAAITACEGEESSGDVGMKRSADSNEDDDGGGAASLQSGPAASALDKAKATMQWLLQNGAIWNQLDREDETPGCVAYRLGLMDLYRIMVDAGTRAELLLSRLDEYEQLAGEDSDGEDGDDAEVRAIADDDDDGAGENTTASDQVTVVTDGVEGQSFTAADNKVDEDPAESNDAFLKSELTFRPAALLDREANGVMMDWETKIMRQTADRLLPEEGLRVLNIGHGMGIVDGMLQAKKPAAHHIIEAHPAVIERLRSQGWASRPGVQVHEGRWQDVVPRLIERGAQFDAVYYDTFAEDYRAFKELFEEHMIGMLDDEGRWSFFNGLGADRQVSYDVYKNIATMELQEAGYEIDWHALDVPDLASQGVWEGTKRPYWTLKQYHLPICSFFTS